MTSTRISLIATSAAAGLWALKGLAIGTAGGLGESPLEGPFFLAGLAAMVIASVALGLALTIGRPWPLRALVAVAAPFVATALAAVVDAAIQTFAPLSEDRHWVWTELNLWVLAALGLALALRLHRSESSGRSGARVAVPAA